jgi:lipopolysaccharide export system protein LptC
LPSFPLLPVLETDTEPLPLAPLLASAPREVVRGEPWPSRLLQGLARWLPILLMATLALFTFWLVRQTAAIAPERAESTPSHTPDYEMRGFAIQRHVASGAAPSVVEGDQVRHFPDTDTYEIDGMRMRWLDDEGHVTLVTARHATMDPARNEVVLIEQGHLQRPAQPGVDQGLDLWGDDLVFDTEAQTMRSTRPVTIQVGAHRFQSGGVVYQHRDQQLELRGGVKGTVRPAR